MSDSTSGFADSWRRRRENFGGMNSSSRRQRSSGNEAKSGTGKGPLRGRRLTRKGTIWDTTKRVGYILLALITTYSLDRYLRGSPSSHLTRSLSSEDSSLQSSQQPSESPLDAGDFKRKRRRPGFPLPIITGRYQVLEEYPHDPDAFTQGLVFSEDFSHLYESSGRFGRSWLGKVQPTQMERLSQQGVDPSVFAEGLTLHDNRLIMITWQKKKGFVFDPQNLNLTKSFDYRTHNGEGWGLTHNDTHLIVSDGSEYLTFWNPETFEVQGEVKVTDPFNNGEAVGNLNELEYVKGVVLANRWYSDIIYCINPANGEVIGKLDMAGLKERLGELTTDINAVLNGIAWHKPSETLYVTGKLWPKIFKVKVEGL